MMQTIGSKFSGRCAPHHYFVRRTWRKNHRGSVLSPVKLRTPLPTDICANCKKPRIVIESEKKKQIVLSFPFAIIAAYEATWALRLKRRGNFLKTKELWMTFHRLYPRMKHSHFKKLLLLLHESNPKKYEFDRGSSALGDNLRYGIFGRKHTPWWGDLYVYFRLNPESDESV